MLDADRALESVRMGRDAHQVVGRLELAAEARRQARDVADAASRVVDAIGAHMRVADELELVVLAAAEYPRHAGMGDLGSEARLRPGAVRSERAPAAPFLPRPDERGGLGAEEIGDAHCFHRR